MVRMVSVRGGSHNGSAMGFRTEHYTPGTVPADWYNDNAKPRKRHKRNHKRKGKMINLRGQP